MGKSIASADRLTAAQRRGQAVELRKLGLTYEKIGQQIGVTTSAAHKLVTGALRDLNEKTAENVAELRRLELERLDQLLTSVISKARQGHLGAVDRVLKIMERRSRLLGLDAPDRVQAHNRHDVYTLAPEELKAIEEMTDEELAAELEGRWSP